MFSLRGILGCKYFLLSQILAASDVRSFRGEGLFIGVIDIVRTLNQHIHDYYYSSAVTYPNPKP